MTSDADQLAQFSRVWLRGVLDADELSILDSAYAGGMGAGARISASLKVSDILGRRGPVAQALAPIMKDAFPTRVVAFDKTPDHNWGVPWHQDRVIALAERHDVAGFTNWTQKAGAWHCEPPMDVLKNMLFVRIHLDDDATDGGAMQIALGSHNQGRVAASDTQSSAEQYDIETCIGQRGDILVLNMLTLHRSSPAQSASTRRVLRIDYANTPLPTPLTWSQVSQ